jgi:NAD(P)-dependent dehydrogenase (short-subunit alcohol dehydrogenase family)
MILSIGRGRQTEQAQEDRAIRQGLWQTGMGFDLTGKVLGIVGLGRIGSRIAAFGNQLSMRVLAWSPNLTEQRATILGANYAPLDDLFKQSDIVTLHLRLSERTEGIIAARQISLMKSSACLVNTARGQLLDEAALVIALRQNRIRGAALDVFQCEPLPNDHPLRSLENVVVTPHMGYVSVESYNEFFRQAGRIDGLVNNAGRSYAAAVEEIEPELFDEIFHLNVLGPIVAMQAVIRVMRAQGGGSIVNINSGTAFMTVPQYSVYTASKRALLGFTLTARAELEKDRIVVSEVYPFITATNFGNNRMGNPAGGGPAARYADGDKPEFVAGLVLQAVEEGQAQYFANDRLRKMAGAGA